MYTKPQRVGRILIGAATAVAVLLLPNCGGETIEPSTLGDSTSEPSKTPEKNTPTPGVDQPTEAEAKALIEKFIQARNEVSRTGETDAFLSLCTKDSQVCREVVTFEQDTRRNGGSYIGDPSLRLVEIASAPEGTDPVRMSAYVEYDTHKWVAKKGAKPETVKGGVFLFEFELAREGEEWKVQEFVFEVKQ